jgi:hypothetical protein
VTRTLSDRRALDAIAARLNQRRNPNDIAAALLLLIDVSWRVRETGRRVPQYRRRPFTILPKAEQQLRDAVQRCLTHGYELDQVSRIVLDLFKVPIVTVAPAKGRRRA